MLLIILLSEKIFSEIRLCGIKPKILSLRIRNQKSIDCVQNRNAVLILLFFE